MAEEVRTLISVLALAGSVLSLYLTRRLWLQANRPIVVAFVDECSSGNVATPFNLIVSNVGNRPALDVGLHCDSRSVMQLLGKNAPQSIVDEVKRCFDEESRIAVLRNGEELFNAFGSYSSDERWQHLNYGANIAVRISYSDLSGRRYSENLKLKVFARNGFAGGVWKIKPAS